MTDTDNPEVFGRPVSGEITRPTHNIADQRPDEDFLPLLDAVLADPTVEAVRWTQSTPYWNDGEPCVFGVGDPRVKFVGIDEGGDEGDGWLDRYDLFDCLDDGSRTRVAKPGYENVFPAFDQLGAEMDNFEVFLNKSFGDHAIVTATREGFNVEFYEHD